MASEALFAKLADALSKPSKAYRTAETGLNIPLQALQGYREGANVADEFRRRKLAQKTLVEALGGNLPAGLEGFGKTTVEGADALAKPIEAIAALQKANREKNEQTQKYQQGSFLVDGKLTRFNPVDGTYEYADNPGVPISTNGKRVIPIGPSGSDSSSRITGSPYITPRVAPTVPVGETEFFGKADTLNSILGDIKKNFRPEYVGPIAGPIGRAVDVYTPFGDENRSHFRNQVSKAFNNLVYLRSGKQINEEESKRLADEFIKTNNSPIAFQTGLKSMQDEMNSLVANRRKALVQSGYRNAGSLSSGTNNAYQNSGSDYSGGNDPLGLFR